MFEQHIIVDFEMNPIPRSDKEHRKYLHQEIIEIGAVKLDRQFHVVDTFSCMVKPEYNTVIDPKITTLTGIVTEDVVDAPLLAAALSSFCDWIGDSSSRIYSWSNSDLFQLEDECWLKELDFPAVLDRWMNFQAVYAKLLGFSSRHRQTALHTAMEQFKIPFDTESAHRALYDAEKTTELLIPFLTGDYRTTSEEIRKVYSTKVIPTTSSMDTASGGALSQLLQKMTSAQAMSPLAACS